jgi:transcriptional regulator with XRE-family HTH domain
MKQNFNELFSKMKPEAQERVKARSSQLLQAMALADIRRAQASTQEQLAKTLGVNQAWISRVERQTDMYLSTLRSYIEALGGELEVSARFDNYSVRLRQFAETQGEAPAEDNHTQIERNTSSAVFGSNTAQRAKSADRRSDAKIAATAPLLANSLRNLTFSDLMKRYGGGSYLRGVHFLGMSSSAVLEAIRSPDLQQKTSKSRLTAVNAIALAPMMEIGVLGSHKEDDRVTDAA